MSLFMSNRHIVQGTFQQVVHPDGVWVAPRLSHNSKDIHNVSAISLSNYLQNVYVSRMTMQGGAQQCLAHADTPSESAYATSYARMNN